MYGIKLIILYLLDIWMNANPTEIMDEGIVFYFTLTYVLDLVY